MVVIRLISKLDYSKNLCMVFIKILWDFLHICLIYKTSKFRKISFNDFITQNFKLNEL